MSEQSPARNAVPGVADAANGSTGPLKSGQPDDAQAQLLGVALESSSTLQLYANGFSLGLSNADVFIILQKFGRPIGVVNLSYTLAKTLSVKLTGLVSDWEKNTKRDLATTDDIERAFSKEDK
jgi:hypothetical protein